MSTRGLVIYPENSPGQAVTAWPGAAFLWFCERTGYWWARRSANPVPTRATPAMPIMASWRPVNGSTPLLVSPLLLEVTVPLGLPPPESPPTAPRTWVP